MNYGGDSASGEFRVIFVEPSGINIIVVLLKMNKIFLLILEGAR